MFWNPILLKLALFSFAVFFIASSNANTPPSIPGIPPGPEFLSKGGRMYDKWWSELGLKAPKKTHPAYPKTGKKKGSATWRCKECHGWDYRGKDGAYAKGSHYTGIKGIQQARQRSNAEIVKILKDQTHQYNQVLKDSALALIAEFVRRGTLDMDAFINPKDKTVVGDDKFGKQFYSQFCQDCHGKIGKKINFGKRKSPVYMGDLARKNPWEVFHKIRHGHPGKSDPKQLKNHMPPMLPQADTPAQASLLKYLQSLGQKKSAKVSAK